MDEKSKKLMDRPVEEDTKIIVEKLVNFGEFTALYEKWYWEGVTASSIICLEEDARKFGEEKLVEYIFKMMQLPVDPQYTYSTKNGYVYVNFGFDAG